MHIFTNSAKSKFDRVLDNQPQKLQKIENFLYGCLYELIGYKIIELEHWDSRNEEIFRPLDKTRAIPS